MEKEALKVERRALKEEWKEQEWIQRKMSGERRLYQLTWKEEEKGYENFIKLYSSI